MGPCPLRMSLRIPTCYRNPSHHLQMAHQGSMHYACDATFFLGYGPEPEMDFPPPRGDGGFYPPYYDYYDSGPNASFPSSSYPEPGIDAWHSPIPLLPWAA